MKTISDSSKILIVFLLFGFLFLQVNPQMQIFASSEDSLKENLSVISNRDYCSKYFEPSDIYNTNKNYEDRDDDSSGKDGIDEDWMFGKIKSDISISKE